MQIGSQDLCTRRQPSNRGAEQGNRRTTGKSKQSPNQAQTGQKSNQPATEETKAKQTEGWASAVKWTVKSPQVSFYPFQEETKDNSWGHEGLSPKKTSVEFLLSAIRANALIDTKLDTQGFLSYHLSSTVRQARSRFVGRENA